MDDADDTAAAMAAAMGFSSFGSQNPNKRRKFNPSTDAVVASDGSTSTLPFHQGVTTTGSNMVPLGTRRQNNDEIDLDDEEEDHDEQQIPSANQEAPQRAADGNANADDFEPQYLDTSRPSAPIVADPTDDLQSKIDAIVGDSADGSLAPPPSASLVSGGGSSVRGGRGGRQHNTNRHGQTEHRWWDDYYDPAFLVNPWEKLEKAKGLEPRDQWMSWEEAKAARR